MARPHNPLVGRPIDEIIVAVESSSRSSAPQFVLMPGMDGTGQLFRPLLGVLRGRSAPQIISYPLADAFSHDQLLAYLNAQLSGKRDLILVAESFSGPLALRYAAEHASQIRAVVLVASFIRPPLPGWLRYFGRPMVFRLPIPRVAIRLLLTGFFAPASLMRDIQTAIRAASPEVLACRTKQILSVDVSDALERCQVPILCLVGAQDRIISRSSLAKAQKLNPSVRIRIINGPHMLSQTQPKRVWSEISRFLGDIGAIERA